MYGPESDKWVASVYWATETMSTVGFGAATLLGPLLLHFSTLCSLCAVCSCVLAFPRKAHYVCLLHPPTVSLIP